MREPGKGSTSASWLWRATPHLPVCALHVRDVRVPLREPLQTLSAGPAGGLDAGPALLLSLLPGTTAVFQRTGPLLLRGRVGVLVPVEPLCSEAAAFALSHHASRVNTLQKQGRLGRVHTSQVLHFTSFGSEQNTTCLVWLAAVSQESQDVATNQRVQRWFTHWTRQTGGGANTVKYRRQPIKGLQCAALIVIIMKFHIISINIWTIRGF